MGLKKIFFRSITEYCRKKFLKPWRKFRQNTVVFCLKQKNTLEKVSFLLVRFLLHPTNKVRGMHGKENECRSPPMMTLYLFSEL